jgi:hypothetical protein
LLTRARNISTKRTKLFGSSAAAALSTRQFEALRTRIQRFSETISKAQPAPETKPE